MNLTSQTSHPYLQTSNRVNPNYPCIGGHVKGIKCKMNEESTSKLLYKTLRKSFCKESEFVNTKL